MLTDIQRDIVLYAVLTALSLWPAWRVVVRAGLPRHWPVWLVLPFLGPVVFAVLLARRPWPVLPKPQPRLHPRERLRREREAASRPPVTE